MLKKNLIIALRHLSRQKTDTFIKMISLCLGITGCLLIAFFLQHEWRYDTFHTKADRLYRIFDHTSSTDGTRDYLNSISPRPLAGFMQNNLPEVQQAVRLSRQEVVVQIDEHLFKDEILFADTNFFSVFSFPLQTGNPSKALVDANQVVLTPATAQKYFGSLDVIGKTFRLRLDQIFYDLKVAGVTQVLPTYSSIPFSILGPVQLLENHEPSRKDGNWFTGEMVTFVELAPQASPKTVEKKLVPLLQKLELANLSNSRFHLQPIEAIHLGPSYFGDLAPTANPKYLYLATVAAVFLLLVGCINFITLAAGRSVNRAREVGVRKTLGATRLLLVRQFLTESFLLSLLAVVVSLLLAYLLLPYLNTLWHKSITFYLWDPYVASILLGIFLCTGLLAGLYPAWILSRFAPAKVLKGQTTVHHRHQMTSGLVVAQFMIASTLLVGTVVMHQQLDLLQHKSLGFEESQVLRIELPFREAKELTQKYRTQLSSLSQVEGMTASWQLFGHEAAGVGYQKLPTTAEDKEIEAFSLGVGPDFLETMQIELLTGRSFPADWQDQPPAQVLINESFAKAMGWDDPVGKTVEQTYVHDPAEIIGVVKDFHFLSLHQPIAPLAIYPVNHYTNLYVRVSGADLLSTVQVLEKKWEGITQEVPFTFHFLDEDVEQQYQTEQRWTQLITYTAGLIIVIACLGLFGMVAMVTTQRTKEIGIRKALGASIQSILLIFSKDYIRLILVACLVTVPVANYFVTEWLQTFAYRIEVHWWMYVAPAIVVLLIALFSVSGQILKAARQNPVDSLRYE